MRALASTTGLTSFTPWYTLKNTMKNTSVTPSATFDSTPSPNHTAKIGARITRGIASRGQRVAVIDTDIQSPGIHALFGLDEDRIKRALNDYLRGTCRIEETALDVSDQLGAQRAAGGALFLVPSSIRAGEITRILREGYDVGRLNDGFSELVRQLRLDHLVIDTHPGL